VASLSNFLFIIIFVSADNKEKYQKQKVKEKQKTLQMIIFISRNNSSFEVTQKKCHSFNLRQMSLFCIFATLFVSQISNAYSTNALSFHRSPLRLSNKNTAGTCGEFLERSHLPKPANIYSNSLAIRGGGTTDSFESFNLKMISPTSASLIAGSFAGAIGVGIAFPLDTLKTKSQVLGQKTTSSSSDGSAVAETQNYNMFQLITLIWQSEGIAGFFGGVRGMMIGQAIIKSMAFSANSSALAFFDTNHPAFLTPVLILIVAACFSGFVTSFLVAPIERIKVMMQASSDTYNNEIDCIKAVLKTEGIGGLLGRGLGPTIAREVPSYAIYFVVYGLLMQTQVAQSLGGAAPLVFGAMSGCACWIPVYPIDVVKTLVQNTEGGKDGSASVLEVSKQLYQEGGIGAFFDGLTPKMLRAAVNHSVTFWIYDLVITAITGAK